ncbi:MAG: hypothetical protein AAFW46_07670 [Pseudomonadota bacterium]
MHTIATFWIGPRLRDFEHCCMRSWLAMGHPVKFFSYEPVANVPPGVELCDAERILPRRVLFDEAPELDKKPFTRANIFRLAMLRRGEGVWCDSDYCMFRPLPAFTDILVGREQNGKLCNAILWLPPEHEILPAVLDAFQARSVPPWSYAKTRWQLALVSLSGRTRKLSDYPKHQWGRHVLEYTVAKYGLEDQVKDYKAFYYPVIYDDTLFKPMDYQSIMADPEVYGLHVFYKTPKAFAAAGPGSFVGWLKATYGDTLEPEI